MQTFCRISTRTLPLDLDTWNSICVYKKLWICHQINSKKYLRSPSLIIFHLEGTLGEKYFSYIFVDGISIFFKNFYTSVPNFKVLICPLTVPEKFYGSVNSEFGQFRHFVESLLRHYLSIANFEHFELSQKQYFIFKHWTSYIHLMSHDEDYQRYFVLTCVWQKVCQSVLL